MKLLEQIGDYYECEKHLELDVNPIITIVGAGIGGLTTVIILTQKGLDEP